MCMGTCASVSVSVVSIALVLNQLLLVILISSISLDISQTSLGSKSILNKILLIFVINQVSAGVIILCQISEIISESLGNLCFRVVRAQSLIIPNVVVNQIICSQVWDMLH